MSNPYLPHSSQIKAIRALRGLQQTDLSEASGVSRTFLSYIEQGRVLPTPEQIQKIEAALNIRFDDPDVQAAFALLGGGQ